MLPGLIFKEADAAIGVVTFHEGFTEVVDF